MQQYGKGKYSGRHTFSRKFNGIIVTQNQYQADTVSDWHYHENPYFGFSLSGGFVEIRKEGEFETVPGILAFCYNQEKHRSEKYKEGARNFFIECEHEWFTKMDIRKSYLEGNFIVENQRAKDLLPQIIHESKSQNSEAEVAIEILVVNLFDNLSNRTTEYITAPTWLLELKDLLHDAPYQRFSLTALANSFGVHPVTISRLFSHFFGTTMGEYIRAIKLEKAIEMLSKKHVPIEAIALQCGFSDHAHLTRVFKKCKGITPSQYRESIFR